MPARSPSLLGDATASIGSSGSFSIVRTGGSLARLGVDFSGGAVEGGAGIGVILTGSGMGVGGFGDIGRLVVVGAGDCVADLGGTGLSRWEGSAIGFRVAVVGAMEIGVMG